jgi:hypothetical protein
MDIYSFKNIQRSSAQQNLYDLFQTTLGDNVASLNLYPYPVSKEEEMRLDTVCSNIFGNNKYIEELGFINNILNPFSIKEGDTIYYFDPDEVYNLYYKDDAQKATNAIKSLVNPAKDTPSANPEETIPTIIPEQLQQITVDYNSSKIKIIDSFE